MRARHYFTDGLHPFVQLLLVGSLALLFSSALTLLAMFLARPLFGITALDTLVQSAIENPIMVAENARQINALKWVQLMASLGTFLIPAIVFARVKFPDGDYLHIRQPTPWLYVVAGVWIMFTVVPLAQVLYEVNLGIQVPDAFPFLKKLVDESHRANEQLTLAFLATPRLSDLWINLIVLAMIPALSEELLFRGCLVQLLNEWFKRTHVAIWAAAFLFSLLHADWYGFFPRMLLGGVLGYLFVWTGSLWIPIVAHACYNGAQVILAYLYDHNAITYDLRSAESLPWPVTAIGTVLFLASTIALYRYIFAKKFIY